MELDINQSTVPLGLKILRLIAEASFMEISYRCVFTYASLGFNVFNCITTYQLLGSESLLTIVLNYNCERYF